MGQPIRYQRDFAVASASCALAAMTGHVFFSLFRFRRLPGGDSQIEWAVPHHCGQNKLTKTQRMSNMRVPTEAEWGDYQADLDQEDSHDLFGGHTNEEMQPHFYRNVIERTDELRWMPIIPFRYYMLGFRDFVMAGNFDGLRSSDAASCFLGLVEEKLEKQHEFILPIMSELLPAVRHVGRNQSAFNADEDIYGSFQEKLKRIEALYSRHGV